VENALVPSLFQNKQRMDLAASALESVGLRGSIEKSSERASGGEQQRGRDAGRNKGSRRDFCLMSPQDLDTKNGEDDRRSVAWIGQREAENIGCGHQRSAAGVFDRRSGASICETDFY